MAFCESNTNKLRKITIRKKHENCRLFKFPSATVGGMRVHPAPGEVQGEEEQMELWVSYALSLLEKDYFFILADRLILLR